MAQHPAGLVRQARPTFATLKDPTSRAYYDRKRAEGKKHNTALICLARRRCDVTFAMLHDRKPYQPRPLPAS